MRQRRLTILTLTVLLPGAPVIAVAQTLTALTLRPTGVTGGQSSTGEVSLSGPAPSGAIVVRLSSSNPAVATVPPSVTVPTGATTATFQVTTVPVASGSFSIITAAVGGGTKTGRLDLAAPVVSSITLTSISVRGGTTVNGTVRLSGPAPSGGFVVQLSSSNPAAAYSPAPSVTVPPGATTRSFTVTTIGVGQSTAVTIAAFAGGGSKTVLLNVEGVLSSVHLSSTSVRGGTGVGASVNLFLPALSNGLTVQLSSSNPAVATVPASVGIPPGGTYGNFTVADIPVAQSATVTITATLDGVRKTAQLTVEAPVLQYLQLGPDKVRGGTGATGEVVISGPAPSGGFVVALSSSDPAVGTVPARVTVPAWARTVQFTITTRRVAMATSVKITASASGATRSQQLTVDP